MGRTITWGELIAIVLFILGAALLFFLVLAAANLVRILKNVNGLMENVRPKLEKTMSNLPEISDNAVKITTQLKENMDSITKVMTNVAKVSDSAKSMTEIIQKDILIKVNGLLTVADGLRKFFVRKKKEKEKQHPRQGSAVYRYTYHKDQTNPEETVIVSEVENGTQE